MPSAWTTALPFPQSEIGWIACGCAAGLIRSILAAVGGAGQTSAKWPGANRLSGGDVGRFGCAGEKNAYVIARNSGELFLASNERPDSFRQQRGVERLSERLVEQCAIETTGVVIVAEKTDQDAIGVLGIPPKVLCDHQGFVSAHDEIDDNTIWMQRFSLDTGFKAAGGFFNFEIVVGQHLIDVGTNLAIGADEQNFAHRFVFQFAQGHSMLFKESNEVFTRDAAVLGTGNSITTQTSGIEPLADSTGCNFTDLGYLASSEDRPHCGLSNHVISAIVGG
jgi:hypothetical protein